MSLSAPDPLGHPVPCPPVDNKDGDPVEFGTLVVAPVESLEETGDPFVPYRLLDGERVPIATLPSEIDRVIAPFADEVELLDTIPGVDRRLAECLVQRSAST